MELLHTAIPRKVITFVVMVKVAGLKGRRLWVLILPLAWKPDD